LAEKILERKEEVTGEKEKTELEGKVRTIPPESGRMFFGKRND